MNDPGSIRSFGYVPSFDGIRAVAVCSVIIFHLRVLTTDGPTYVGVLDDFFRGGFLGVDVFLVLSGFLITALLLREQAEKGRVRFGTFYLRRALRLLPALYFLLVVHLAFVRIFGGDQTKEARGAAAAALYVFNWNTIRDLFGSSNVLGHLWTLSVEGQFYLIWPPILIAFFGIRRSATWVTVGLVAIIAVVAVHRADLWHHDYPWVFLFQRTDARLDAPLVGALLASLWVRGRTPGRGLPALGYLGVAVLVMVMPHVDGPSGFNFEGGHTLYAFAAALIILASIDSNWLPNRFLEAAPVRMVGKLSYGLYLWHHVVFWWIHDHLESADNLTKIGLGLSITVAFSVLSYYVVETPALRLKARKGLYVSTT